jgi:hypothetical protein
MHCFQEIPHSMFAGFVDGISFLVIAQTVLAMPMLMHGHVNGMAE